MDADIWTWLTRLGALTGFIAFMFKVWEFYHDRRPRLRVLFAGQVPDGYAITVLNSSKVGTSIYHYTVNTLPRTLLNRLWPRFGEKDLYRNDTIVAGSFEPVEVEVPAHGQASFVFMPRAPDSEVFRPPGDLYVRLWTTTRRRPFTFLLVPAGPER
jgi:hypothetical protein